jgi:hypothetical protein
MMVRQQALHDHTFLALGRFLNHHFLSSANEIDFKHVSFAFRVLKSDDAEALAEEYSRLVWALLGRHTCVQESW